MQGSYLKPRVNGWGWMQLFAFLILMNLLFSSCVTAKPGARVQRKVAGKTFVIVGASSGFGRGIAEQLGAFKANVVLAARRTEPLEAIAKQVRQAGGRALVVTMDISKPADIERLTEAALKEFEDIDVWINMAGVGAIGRFWEIPVADQARLVDINFKGFVYGSHAAIQQFRKQGYGTLINMGSIESENPLAFHATYAGTKGAVLNMSMAISHELKLSGHSNIKVVVVEPWAVDTPFFQHAANYSGGTPRMPAMDMPFKVVNATIRASINPRRELAVGGKAKMSRFSHRLFPRFTERVSVKLAYKYQFKTAPPAPVTKGSLYEPVTEGQGIVGGNKARIRGLLFPYGWSRSS